MPCISKLYFYPPFLEMINTDKPNSYFISDLYRLRSVLEHSIYILFVLISQLDMI